MMVSMAETEMTLRGRTVPARERRCSDCGSTYLTPRDGRVEDEWTANAPPAASRVVSCVVEAERVVLHHCKRGVRCCEVCGRPVVLEDVTITIPAELVHGILVHSAEAWDWESAVRLLVAEALGRDE